MADVDSSLYQWSTTESSNKPTGGTTVGPGLDDNIRQIQATVRAWLASKGADIASATTTDLGAAAGLAHDITGTTTITSFGTVAAGIWKILKFEGALTLTHNATSLILLGGEDHTTANGDVGIYISEGSGNWRELAYFPVAINPAKAVSTDETQELTNKTLNASVGKGTWTASGTWILPAVTFNSTVTLSGTAANIATGSNYISNGGTDAGLSFDSSNNASLSAALAIAGTLSGRQTALGGSTTQLGGYGGGAAQVAIRSNQGSSHGLEISTSADTTDGVFAAFVNASNSSQGSIKATNSTTTAYATSSDARLKDDLGPASEEDAASRLRRYQIRNIRWKQNGVLAISGLAQQIHEVNPAVGHRGGDDPNKEPWTIEKGAYTDDLVLGWQYMDKRVAALEKVIEDQQRQLEELKKQVP